MAISALESTNSSSPIRSPGSPIRAASSCRLSLNKSHANNEKSATSNSSNPIKLPKDCNSPYLMGDKVHVKSRVTGKSFTSKKEECFTSSFPLAAKIYRANSDEFQNLKRNIKKTKKSVLTLPNVQAPKQQEYTVSDTNDSELFNRANNHELQSKLKRPIAPKKKPASLANRGSPCSQLFGYSADSSSIEMITHFDGDANRKKKNMSDRQNSMYRAKAYDVWTMLRNMNRFQFKPSPAISEESVVTSKKEKVNRKQKYRNDSRVIQTRHREQEIQYISNFEIETLSPSNSFCRASSSGRVTVIDKNDPFDDLCHEFQERIQQIERAGFYHDQPWNCNKNKRRNKKSPNKNKKAASKKVQHVDNPVQKKMPMIPYGFPFAANNSDFSNASSQMTLKSEQTEVNNGHYNLKITAKPQTVDTAYTTSKPVNNNKPKTFQRKINENISMKTKNFVNENIKIRKSPIESTENISGISGITQVVMNNSTINTLLSPLRSVSPRSIKSRPNKVSRYQNSATEPRQTLEVKRRLARLKFPIIILGRDQVSSSYEVLTFDAPQFEGLPERIWPFMTDWYRYKDLKGQSANGISRKVNRVFQYCWNRKPDEDAKLKQNTSPTSMQKRKDDLTKISRTKPSMQRTPMAQFKDKMLKFLHKSPAANNRVQTQTTNTKTFRTEMKPNSTVDAKSTEQIKPSSPVLRSRNSVKRPATLDSIIRQANIKVDDISLPIKATKIYDLRVKQNAYGRNSEVFQKPLKKPRQTWAKASQASNFIDNVISKIRTGVYCNQVNGFSTESLFEVKETTRPIYTPSSSTNCTIESKIINDKVTPIDLPKRADNAYDLKTDPLKTFGGFDETFPGLEVETINKNRVAIKNCIMNVLVHFDIAAPVGLKKSAVVNETNPFSCVPVTVSNNKTQIFKCTTTIVNAILPAELCTLLPNMMRNILLMPKFPPGISPLDANKSQLSVITEVSKGESHFLDALLFTSTIEWSPELQELVCGRFNTASKIQTKNTPAIDFNNVYDLLLPRPSLSICIPIQTDFRIFCFTVNGINQKTMLRPPQCTALVPYKPPCRMLTNIINRSCFTHQVITYTGLDKIINQVSRIPLEFTIREIYYNRSSTCTALVKYVKPLRIELLERLKQNDTVHKINKSSVMKLKKKIKKKGFVRLFRRCKSTTNLTLEHCTTALSKITNLEEFLLALGSGKTLCSVFDKDIEGKIMKCIIQMKNWISEISPRQTLLVLLLMIKKETPNMMKLRPIILQAIAANRITRTRELDMEVEVIERESFNKISKYEGACYLPAACENYDSLIEELSWIAKTTASDYQKTFDESSERLLKSLLDKRNKLNPSYLRVMARYVGLGLLKTPK